MKQARFWLLSAAAMLLPHAAFAQPRRPGEKAPALAQPATPPPPPPTSVPTDLGDIDSPAPAAGASSAGAAAAAGSTGSASSGSGDRVGGICDVDPSACAGTAPVGALRDRDVKADIYAVQQIYALRRGRFELMPYWSFSLNDQFVGHPGPGFGLNYYLTDVLAVGINGTFHQPFNTDLDFNFQNRRASRVAVPLNEYQAVATANFTYVPIYGKFSTFREFIFHYDGYVVGGVGVLRSRPIPVIDPDNRTFDWNSNVTMTAGLGLRVFINRWFAVTAELRDYIYVEQVENTRIAPTASQQRDPLVFKWIDEKPLTNNVQAQIGISVFLPFGWDYRLPK